MNLEPFADSANLYVYMMIAEKVFEIILFICIIFAAIYLWRDKR